MNNLLLTVLGLATIFNLNFVSVHPSCPDYMPKNLTYKGGDYYIGVKDNCEPDNIYAYKKYHWRFEGWCPCEKYDLPKLNPTKCDYGCERCKRKLPKVKWELKSGGKRTALTSHNIAKYCSHINCQKAYEKGSSSSRKDYWRSCRSNTLSEFKQVYGVNFEVDNDTVNFC